MCKPIWKNTIKSVPFFFILLFPAIFCLGLDDNKIRDIRYELVLSSLTHSLSV